MLYIDIIWHELWTGAFILHFNWYKSTAYRLQIVVNQIL